MESQNSSDSFQASKRFSALQNAFPLIRDEFRHCYGSRDRDLPEIVFASSGLMDQSSLKKFLSAVNPASIPLPTTPPITQHVTPQPGAAGRKARAGRGRSQTIANAEEASFK